MGGRLLRITTTDTNDVHLQSARSTTMRTQAPAVRLLGISESARSAILVCSQRVRAL